MQNRRQFRPTMNAGSLFTVDAQNFVPLVDDVKLVLCTVIYF